MSSLFKTLHRYIADTSFYTHELLILTYCFLCRHTKYTSAATIRSGVSDVLQGLLFEHNDTSAFMNLQLFSYLCIVIKRNNGIALNQWLYQNCVNGRMELIMQCLTLVETSLCTIRTIQFNLSNVEKISIV